MIFPTETRRLFIVGGTSLACLILYLAFRPVDTGWRKDPVVQRYQNLNRIGNAVRHYAEAHDGKLPDRLSQLVPDYISYSNTVWLLQKENAKTLSGMVSDSEPIAERIDRDGAFIYVGERGRKKDLLAYERPLLWSSGTRTGVPTMTTNFTARLRPAKDVQEAINGLTGVNE